MTLSRRQVNELLTQHGLRPSRALGQNFVADPNTVRRIARLAEVGPGDNVIEVGAGLGSLTLALAETGADVLAVEADRHLVPVLEDVLSGAGVSAAGSTGAGSSGAGSSGVGSSGVGSSGVGRSGSVRVVHGDAMRADWPALLAGSDRWALVANLPYNIATPLVADLLDTVPQVARMLVMVQAELGERLAAGPRDPAYGAVSVKVAYWATASVVGRVPASVFIPRPNVESVLVDIRRRPEPAVDCELVEPSALFALVRAGFAQRRKMLRRALSGLVSPAAFAAARVAPESRAEELGVEDWGRLAVAVAAERDSPHGNAGGPDW